MFELMTDAELYQAGESAYDQDDQETMSEVVSEITRRLMGEPSRLN